MWNTFRGTALVVVVLAGTAQLARSQPAPMADTNRNTGTIVFHGVPGELPAYGSSTPPGFATSAGGTTVLHGTPAGTLPRPSAPPPWALPPPPPGYGR